MTLANSLESRLEGILPAEQLRYDEPMDGHTTFRAGGHALCLAYPASEQELRDVIQACGEMSVPWMMLGKGSNLLVSDSGYPGVMISLEKFGQELRTEGHRIICSAGISLSALAREALQHGLAGLEFASGIPGTVGGAMMMNAGAYGSEMKNVVKAVRVMSPDGKVLCLETPEMELGYRASRFAKTGEIVLSAEFELQDGNPDEIRSLMQDLAQRRRDKQPLEYPSAGSTFKRPVGYFAGKLIQDSGLAGYTVGGAQVSEKHCGFVINRGGATASDIWNLCRDVQRIVYEKYGVELETEVKLVGDFA